jgi:hypothetical protein
LIPNEELVMAVSLPPMLLILALGLALAFVPNRARAFCLILMGAGVVICMVVTIRTAWLELALLACWISVVATAAAVYLPSSLRLAGTFLLSLNAGVWATAVVALSGSPADLLIAGLCVVVCVPASCLVRRGGAATVKIASSSLMAVALLVGTLHFLPVTSGFLPK